MCLEFNRFNTITMFRYLESAIGLVLVFIEELLLEKRKKKKKEEKGAKSVFATKEARGDERPLSQSGNKQNRNQHFFTFENLFLFFIRIFSGNIPDNNSGNIPDIPITMLSLPWETLIETAISSQSARCTHLWYTPDVILR